MALTGGKPTKRSKNVNGRLCVGVAAGVTIFQGALVLLANGYARPGRPGQGANDLLKQADVATYRAIGVADQSVIGGVTDGAVTVNVEEGIYLFRNSAGADALTAAEVDRYCYVVDDETVAKTNLGGTRARAGIVKEVTSEGVWVEISGAVSSSALRMIVIPFYISETDTLAGTSAEVVSPVSGRIARLSVIVQKDVTTGGDVTAAVGTTAVAGLACTIANAATKGTVATGVPTAGDATANVAAGSRIQIVPGAPFNGAGAVSGFIEIGY